MARSRDVEGRPRLPADAVVRETEAVPDTRFAGVRHLVPGSAAGRAWHRFRTARSDEPQAAEAQALGEPAAGREREDGEGEDSEQEIQLHVHKTGSGGRLFPFHKTAALIKRKTMTSVIVIAVLWVGNVVLLRWLGGVGSAGDALARWGKATAEKRRRRLASSS